MKIIPLSAIIIMMGSCCVGTNSTADKDQAKQDTAVMAPATDTLAAPSPKVGLLVLTYNICWQSMTNKQSANASANNLGGKCVFDNGSTPPTICAQAMADLIESTPKQYGHASYDLIGLQEASNWQNFKSLAPSTMATMSAISHTSVDKHGSVSHMATFFDPAKYHLERTVRGQFEKGRPFIVSFFTEGVIFINLHNGHGFPLSAVAQTLGQSVSDSIPPSQRTPYQGYRMIVVGDFNISAPGAALSFIPLAKAGINTVCKMSNAPRSCCIDGDSPGGTPSNPPKGYYRNGDFIFDSGSTSQPEIPVGYQFDEYQSDHLPVLSALPPMH